MYMSQPWLQNQAIPNQDPNVNSNSSQNPNNFSQRTNHVASMQMGQNNNNQNNHIPQNQNLIKQEGSLLTPHQLEQLRLQICAYKEVVRGSFPDDIFMAIRSDQIPTSLIEKYTQLQHQYPQQAQRAQTNQVNQQHQQMSHQQIQQNNNNNLIPNGNSIPQGPKPSPNINVKYEPNTMNPARNSYNQFTPQNAFSPSNDQQHNMMPNTMNHNVVNQHMKQPQAINHPYMTNSNNNNNNMNRYQQQTAPPILRQLPVNYLIQERDRAALAKIKKRIEDLTNAIQHPNLSPAQRMKLSIELKSLSLLTAQKMLRQKISEQVKPVKQKRDQDYKNEEVKWGKKIYLDKTETRQKRDGVQDAQNKAAFNKAVEGHVKSFRGFHQNRNKMWKKINRQVVSHYNTQVKRDQTKKNKEEKERLKALKEEDEEQYLLLLNKTKNDRLRALLNQTNEYLQNIGQLVARHQEEEIAEEKEEEKRAVEQLLKKLKDEDPKVAEDKEEEDKDEEKEVKTEDKASVKEEKQNEEKSSEEKANEEKIKTEAANEAANRKNYYTMAHKVEEEVHEQPKMLVGGILKPYQLQGLQWLISLYNNRLNGILADEMGLGKTIQTISLICYLIEKKNNNGPYLIVVPNSTTPNWLNEFTAWAPDIPVVLYVGNPKARKALYNERVASGKFKVLITTYDFVMKDKATLAKQKWNYVIIDEGHRMKNSKCKLALTFSKYSAKHKILLTGTPLQNNLPELWSLLNFLLPSIFNCVENFEEWFNAPFANTGEKMEMTKEERLLIIQRLHKVLRPFLLRRLKKEVEFKLPDKTEHILNCGRSAWQTVMYDEVISTGELRVDPDEEMHHGPTRGGAKMKVLKNRMMQLRKICNHPFLFQKQWFLNEDLIRASGKFSLIDRILPKLQETGHRVLMFSQMTQLIDIMEDYFTYRGYKYLRLDGGTKGEDRGELVKKFNEKESEIFIFVLSTRAGGLGLNLQTADTVILFDSDWNPHVDLQALDRAHRIGQTREVRIFRLITVGTVEQAILARANYKKGLDQKIIEAGKFNDRSSATERRNLLQDLLEAEKITQAKDTDLPTDEHMNRLLARGDDEFGIFQEMDIARREAEEMEWKRNGGKGPVPPRLMTRAELPDWMVRELSVEDNEGKYGRGMRSRNEVNYNMDKAANEEGVEEEEVKKEGRNGVGRGKRKREVVEVIEEEEEEDDEGEEEEEEEVVPVNKKRRVSKEGGAGGKKEKEEKKQKQAAVNNNTNPPVDEKRGVKRARIVFTEPKPQNNNSSNNNNSSSSSSSSSSTTNSTSNSSSAPNSTNGKKQQQAPKARGRPKTKEGTSEQSELKENLLKIWNKIRKDKDPDSGRVRSALFVTLPSKRDYADYYSTIIKPIDLTKIKAAINKNAYGDAVAAKKDFVLLFKNAQYYNTEGYDIHTDAVWFERMVKEEFKTLCGVGEEEGMDVGKVGREVGVVVEEERPAKKRKKGAK
eukprot:TRINITY_DN2514_c0_g1_i1.p1 TRINITY_DN2514_c0_g1~~TRINITY_DN2514_c0_g1_i1.p1  ORF type:complete len:1470 (+),score=521.14 TRINITY_DN2514_c0_g1_i1:62-4471(+)